MSVQLSWVGSFDNEWVVSQHFRSIFAYVAPTNVDMLTLLTDRLTFPRYRNLCHHNN